LGDTRNEVRLVCLRFLQEALHPVLDQRFPRKFGTPSWRVSLDHEQGSSPSLQSYPSRQCEFLAIHFWF